MKKKMNSKNIIVSFIFLIGGIAMLVFTLLVMLRKQYSKTRFWLIVVLCVLSYVLPVFGLCFEYDL